MTERTTDPDAGRLEAGYVQRYARWWAELRDARDRMPGNERCTLEEIFGELGAQSREIAPLRAENAALRERAERAEAERDEARALVKSAWREGHNIGLGDGHPLAGPPHRWEDSDACADLAALSASPAPEVRDGK